jgi:hypothetical protein
VVGPRRERLRQRTDGGDRPVAVERPVVLAVVAREAPGVQQQLLDGDAGRGAAQAGDEVAHRVRERQLPVVHQGEHRRGGERLADRADGEHGVDRVGGACRRVRRAVGRRAVDLPGGRDGDRAAEPGPPPGGEPLLEVGRAGGRRARRAPAAGGLRAAAGGVGVVGAAGHRGRQGHEGRHGREESLHAANVRTAV